MSHGLAVIIVRIGASLRLTCDGGEQFRVPIWSPDEERTYCRETGPFPYRSTMTRPYGSFPTPVTVATTLRDRRSITYT